MILTPQFTILSIHDKDDITEQVCFSLTVCGCGEGVNIGFNTVILLSSRRTARRHLIIELLDFEGFLLR